MSPRSPIGGQQKPAIRIQIDPQKLVAKDMSLEDVRTQLALTTVNNPKGNFDGLTRSYTVYANDQLTRAEDWNDVILAYKDGAPLRIRDIGVAVAGPEDTKQAAWANGQRGVFLVVFKQPGANVIDTVDKIMEALPRLTASLPKGIHISILSDRTQTIRASVRDVQFTLLLTIALVVGVIFVFLRNVSATLIPSVAVPLALLGACGLMWLAGYTLDNLSLMAMTISVGFVVDDAIVMLENITRYVEKGMKPVQAALKGAGEIGFTIISISISLDRGADPAALDERHHRPAVPRIRRRAGDDHRRLRLRVAHPDAGDGRALPAPGRRNAPRPSLCAERARLQRPAARL